ncbi:MAG: YHYH protein [Bacteroidota bacterium]
MRNIPLTVILCVLGISVADAQLSPAITSWLQNISETGSFYMDGNSTPIDHGFPYNCQKVEYSNDYVYVQTYTFPAYPIGPFIDGTPNFANTESVWYQFPLNPTPNTGMPSQTTPGNIAVLINGTSLFDFRDDVAWDSVNNTLCGGFLNTPCPGGMGAPQSWNRDAVLAEKAQFDCSKGHPFMGAYHHHQNPSAYKLDLNVISTICNLYDADGLYQIDSTQHSPLSVFL